MKALVILCIAAAAYGHLYCDMNLIEDGIWLGGINGTSPECLRTHNISAIMTVRTSMIANQSIDMVDHYIWIKAQDTDIQQLYDMFNDSYAYLRSWHRQKRYSLVHCDCGHSRSATVMAAYLMRHFNITARDALARILKKRSVDPNDGFQQQLNVFDYYCHASYNFNPYLQATLWPKSAHFTRVK